MVAKEKERELAKKAKEAELRRKKEEAALFQTAITQPKVPFGVDPKTIMCAFFKAGVCEKGEFFGVLSWHPKTRDAESVCYASRQQM